MFQFTTTTIINNVNDTLKNGKKLVDEITSDGGYDNNTKVIRLGKNLTFLKDDDHKVCAWHNAGYPLKCDSIEKIDTALGKVDAYITANNLDDKATRRLALYVRSNGNADPLFANDFVFKGAPFYVEFNGTLENLAKNFGKYQSMTIGEKLFEIDKDKKTITCANEYMRIHMAQIHVMADDELDGHWNIAFDFAADENDKMPGDEGYKNSDYIITGYEGFGTYDALMKDYRLPTGANLRWKGVAELPKQNVIYDQFIVHYTVNRGIMGLGAVGMKATSETTHVFWVPQTQASAFKGILEKVCTVTPVKTPGVIEGTKDTVTPNAPLDANEGTGGYPGADAPGADAPGDGE